MKHLFALLFVLPFLCGGCSNPLTLAHAANLIYTDGVITATALHDTKQITDDQFNNAQLAAELAKPGLDELNRVAEEYAAAKTRNASEVELQGIKINARNIWNGLEPKLLDIADQFIAARRAATQKAATSFQWLPQKKLAA